MSSVHNVPALAGNGTPADHPYMTEYQVRLLATEYVMEALATLFVAFRIYCRIRYLKRLLWADAWLVVALILQIAVQVLNVIEVKQSMTVAGTSPMVGIKAAFTEYVAFWCLRTSVALMFMEIFPAKRAKIVLWIGLAVNTITSWVPVFWMGALAWPLYNDPVRMFNRIARVAPYGMIMQTGAGMIFDVGAVVLPTIPIWKLNMTLGKRVALIFILAIGWFTVACSAIRFTISIKEVIGGPMKIGMQTNYTIFSAVEMHVALIASCLITTWRIILSRFLPKSISKYFVKFIPSWSVKSWNKRSKNWTGRPQARMPAARRNNDDLEEGDTLKTESKPGDEPNVSELRRSEENALGNTVGMGTGSKYDQEEKDNGIEMVVSAGSEGRMSF